MALIPGHQPASGTATARPGGDGVAAAGLAPAARPRGMFRRGWEIFAQNRLAMVSLFFMVFVTLFCFAGPRIYRTDQVHTNLQLASCTPSARHLLGCTDVGYDVLGRLMTSGQISLEVGFAAAIVAVVFGTLYGAISGFVGGWIDAVLMRIVDAGLSVPYITVIIMLSVVLRPSSGVMVLVIAGGYWLAVSRLVRGETLSLRTREYVQAVKIAGGSGLRSVVRHILPNAIGTIIVQGTFAVADSIIILASLGFLGLGVQPPSTDWGTMLTNGLQYIEGSNPWWLIYPPGVAIIGVCIAINFIGDALRDAFETRLQRR